MSETAIADCKKDFPVLQQSIYDKPLVYLDNAASTQKPQCVLDSIMHYYQHDNANVHRGVHALSMRATDAYENARQQIQQFINAKTVEEIIFVKGTTEAINLVAHSYAGEVLQADDEVIISALEHHANIVPWQIVCQQTGAKLRIIPMNDKGELLLEDYQQLFNARTKMVALSHISNAIGTINPIKEMIRIAHEYDVPVLIDGAQSAPHMSVDMQDLDCDFYTFSGHKTFGPMGIGALFAKSELQQKMRPYQAGGDMIRTVSFTETTYSDPPFKFEAGTPNVAGAVGLDTALRYLTQLDMNAIAQYEQTLLQYATERLLAIPGLRIIGEAAEKAAIISFVFEHIHPHDVGTIVDREGIAIRTGHHCAMPLMNFFCCARHSARLFLFL